MVAQRQILFIRLLSGDPGGDPSCGVLGRPGEDFAVLLQRADASLYAAKNRGRRTLVWNSEPVSDTGCVPSDQPA